MFRSARDLRSKYTFFLVKQVSSGSHDDNGAADVEAGIAFLADRRRPTTAAHEAGHAVAAHMLGGSVGPVSIRETRRWGGVAFVGGRRLRSGDLDDERLGLPFVMLPPRVGSRFQHEAVIALAGPLAEKVYGPELVARLRTPSAVAAGTPGFRGR